LPEAPGPQLNERLNENCVICLAPAGEDGQLIVRQVRPTFKAVFEEDMVVVGCRFFVPG
jgi:hypothetical protein